MSTTALPRPEIDYPSSDGKPMAENDWQLHAMLYAIGVLQAHFARRPDVYVSGDTLIYYEEGNIGKSVAPDVFVVLGAPAHKRMVYKLWEEPKAPDFVLEVASPKTWKDDEGRKGELYARLGVREYWQYDPMGGLLPVRLRGRRLVDGGVYEAQPVVEGPDGTLMLRSETLGLDLLAGRGGELHFRDPSTGRLLLGLEEMVTAHRSAESLIEHEAAGRRVAEARVEQETAARRATEAAHRTAEARIAELEALLRDRSG